jgi:energy-coupling factor transport system ATP-binding protein
LYGFYNANSGEILIDDLPLKKNVQEIRKKMGICLQNPESQIIFSAVVDELAYILSEYDDSTKETLINSAFAKLGIQDFKDKDLYSLSAGQKQKVILAESIVNNPKYLLLDEPTSMLDSKSKKAFYELLDELRKECTVIYTTNNVEEVLHADRIIIINEGVIYADILKSELIDNIDLLYKSDVEVPFLFSILSKIKEKGISIDNSDFSYDNLENKILELIEGDNHKKAK